MIRVKRPSPTQQKILIIVLFWAFAIRAAATSTNVAFLALSDTNDAIPPDTHGAVGPDHVLTVLNTQIRIQRKNGDHVRTSSLQSFWAPVGDVKPFDPKVVYDPAQGRWILVAANNRGLEDSSVLLAVSENADPSGNWKFRKLLGETGTSRYVDYPSVGFNDKWVAIQYLERTTQSNLYARSQLLVFSKQSLLSGDEEQPRKFSVETEDYVQMPAITHGPEEKLYLASVPVEPGKTRSVKLHAITGTIGNEELTLVREFTLPSGWVTKSPGSGNFVSQLDTSAKLHIQDTWMHSVVVRNGSIWACHPVLLPEDSPSRVGVQWLEISESEVRQWGRIEDASGVLSYIYPSISVNAANDVLIGFSVSGATIYPSGGYAARMNDDPPGMMRNAVIFREGEGPYQKTKGTGKNRWGDYSSTVVDPVDDMTFWTIQEYAEAPEGDPAQDGSGRWGTWWQSVAVPDSSELRLTVRIQSPAELAISFASEPGVSYRLEASPSLENSAWTTLQTVSPAETEATILVPQNDGISRFFRLVKL